MEFKVLEELSPASASMYLGSDGHFLCKSGSIIATDPCYTHAEGVVKNCATGKWTAYITKALLEVWGHRVAALWIFHEDAGDPASLLKPKWSFKNGELRVTTPWQEETSTGVDSGQAGFWDEKSYVRHRSTHTEVIRAARGERDAFYKYVCANSDEGCYTEKPDGACSSSGCGDGAYLCRAVRDRSGLVMAMCLDYLQFIPAMFQRRALDGLDPKDLPKMLGHVDILNEEWLAELIKGE